MQNLINSIKNYVSLSKEDISIIEKLFIKKELKKNEYFLKQGNVCNHFAFVEKGLLRHYMHNDGEEETFYFCTENDFVYDYESFINRAVSKKTIIALEDTTTYSISYKDIQNFYAKVSTGERFGRLLLEEVFSKAIKHIISTHTDSAKQKDI